MYDDRRNLKYAKAIKIARNTLFAIPAVATAAYISLSQGYLVQNYRKWFQLTDKNGNAKKVSEKVGLTCLSALEDTRIVHKKKMRTKFFHATGTDVFSLGSYEMKGVVIGIPYNFTYNSISDINKDDIRISNMKIDSKSEIEEQLLKTLILSEDAKKFAVSREMYFGNNGRIILTAMLASFSVIIPPCMSDLLEKFAKNALRNIRMTLLFYAATIPFSILQYFFFEGLLHKHYDLLADKNAISLGENYRKGAIEYYEKKILFNKTCREIGGEFTEEGDPETWFLQRLKLKDKLNAIKNFKNEKLVKNSVTEELTQ